MNSRELKIHIDRLVVEGLPAQGQRRFVRALENQLAELASGLPVTSIAAGRIASVDAGQMRAGATPEHAASQVTAALRTAIAGRGNSRG